MPATEPIRDKKQLQSLATYFLERREYRNHVMIVLGASTALRISDLLRLRWDDVYDEKTRQFRSHITVTEHKTGKPKIILLNAQAIVALRRYLPHRRGAFLFSNHRREEKPISRVQAWRIIHAAVIELQIPGKIACHSLRKTFGYHAWTSAGVSPVILMQIYNHASYSIIREC